MGDLSVELYGQHIGRLVGTDARTFDFATDEPAFDVFQLGDNVLSHAVPLVPRTLESIKKTSTRRSAWRERGSTRSTADRCT